MTLTPLVFITPVKCAFEATRASPHTDGVINTTSCERLLCNVFDWFIEFPTFKESKTMRCKTPSHNVIHTFTALMGKVGMIWPPQRPVRFHFGKEYSSLLSVLPAIGCKVTTFFSFALLM